MTERTDEEAARVRALAFNTEAVRSGMFAAAIDIADTMRENGVENGESCLLTGCAEMVAQLWQQVAEKAGIPRATARKTLEREIRTFYAKHAKASEREAAEATVQ